MLAARSSSAAFFLISSINVSKVQHHERLGGVLVSRQLGRKTVGFVDEAGSSSTSEEDFASGREGPRFWPISLSVFSCSLDTLEVATMMSASVVVSSIEEQGSGVGDCSLVLLDMFALARWLAIDAV